MSYINNPFDHIPPIGPDLRSPFNRAPVFSTMGRGPRGEKGERGFPGEESRKDFEIVEKMAKEKTLEVGDICHTLGFHESGDGGAAWYEIVEDAEANGMDILALENGMFAVLQVTESYVTPEMFGAHGDGVSYDDNAFLKTFSSGYPIQLTNNKVYLFESELEIVNWENNIFNGNKATLKFATGLINCFSLIHCSYSNFNNFIIDCNDCENGLIANMTKGSIDNLKIINFTSTGFQNVGAISSEYASGYESIFSNITCEASLSNVSSSDNIIGYNIKRSDCVFENLFAKDCTIAVYVTNGFTLINDIHCWMSVASAARFANSSLFYIATDNPFIASDIYCDSYQTLVKTAGWVGSDSTAQYSLKNVTWLGAPENLINASTATVQYIFQGSTSAIQKLYIELDSVTNRDVIPLEFSTIQASDFRGTLKINHSAYPGVPDGFKAYQNKHVQYELNQNVAEVYTSNPACPTAIVVDNGKLFIQGVFRFTEDVAAWGGILGYIYGLSKYFDNLPTAILVPATIHVFDPNDSSSFQLYQVTARINTQTSKFTIANPIALELNKHYIYINGFFTV